VASLLGRIYFPALHDLPALPPASANASDGFQPRQVEMAGRLERILKGEFATFACYFQDVCRADSEQLRLTCETGYRGAFCGACDPHEGFGYTREVDGCAECLDLPSLTAIAVVTALLMGLLITFFSICQNFGRRSPRKIILRLLLNHLQLVSSMNLLQVEFNSAIRTLFSSSDAASGSFMQLPTFQCFFPDSFFTQYALGLVFPVLVCLVSVIAQVSFVAYSRVRYGDEPPPVPEHLIKDHIQRLNIDRDGATDEKAQDEAAQRIAAVVKTTSVSKAEPAPAGAPAPPPRRLSMRTGRTAASNQAAAAAVGAASSSAKKKGHPLVRAVAYQVRRFKEGAILRQARLRSWESLFHRREIVPPLLVLLYLTYNSFARAVVAVFSCTAPVNGVRYLTADLNVQCGTPTHLAAVSASVVLVITVCLGTPALFAFILYKNRKALYDPQIYSLMGALFDGFDADHGTFAWQAVIMLRNFALVAVVRSISEPQLQLMGSILVTTTALCFHLAFLPYTVLLYNQVETVSLSSVAFAQMMSMSLVNGIGDESAKAEGVSGGISAIVVNGVGYMLLALHLCVFLMFVYFFLKPPPQVGAKKTRSVSVSSIAKVTQARNPNASMASSKKPSKGGSAPPALPAGSPDTLSSLPESRDILTANPLRSGPSFTGSLGQVSDKLTHDPVPARKGPSGAANRSSRVAALADGKAQEHVPTSRATTPTHHANDARAVHRTTSWHVLSGSSDCEYCSVEKGKDLPKLPSGPGLAGKEVSSEAAKAHAIRQLLYDANASFVDHLQHIRQDRAAYFKEVNSRLDNNIAIAVPIRGRILAACWGAGEADAFDDLMEDATFMDAPVLAKALSLLDGVRAARALLRRMNRSALQRRAAKGHFPLDALRRVEKPGQQGAAAPAAASSDATPINAYDMPSSGEAEATATWGPSAYTTPAARRAAVTSARAMLKTGRAAWRAERGEAPLPGDDDDEVHVT
ncbi:unnamed protein product, partial [Symbiodinium sp. KB8]